MWERAVEKKHWINNNLKSTWKFHVCWWLLCLKILFFLFFFFVERINNTKHYLGKAKRVEKREYLTSRRCNCKSTFCFSLLSCFFIVVVVTIELSLFNIYCLLLLLLLFFILLFIFPCTLLHITHTITTAFNRKMCVFMKEDYFSFSFSFFFQLKNMAPLTCWRVKFEFLFDFQIKFKEIYCSAALIWQTLNYRV